MQIVRGITRGNRAQLIACIGSLLVSGAVHAQKPPPPPNVPAAAQAPATPSKTPPPYREQRHCNLAAPPGGRASTATAVVLFRADIDVYGTMRNPVLYRSSGNADFDKAVLACADGNLASAVHSGGLPADANGVVGYFAWPGGSSLLTPLANGSMALCQNYPPEEVKAGNQGDVVFSYRVTADGWTKDVKIVKSSGFPGLDQASRDCASSWRFFSYMKNGQPIEVEREGAAKWRLTDN
jgi:TonB family protein